MSKRLIDLATQGDIPALSLLMREAQRQGLSWGLYPDTEAFVVEIHYGAGCGYGGDGGDGTGSGIGNMGYYLGRYGDGYGNGDSNCTTSGDGRRSELLWQGHKTS